MAHGGNFNSRSEAPNVGHLLALNFLRKPGDGWRQRPQNSLSGQLAERQQAQRSSGQSGTGRIEIKRKPFPLPAIQGRRRRRRTPSRDGPASRPFSTALKKIGRQSVQCKRLAQIRRDAQYLSSHLAAGVAQFTCRLHGIEVAIDGDALFHSQPRLPTAPLSAKRARQ